MDIFSFTPRDGGRIEVMHGVVSSSAEPNIQIGDRILQIADADRDDEAGRDAGSVGAAGGFSRRGGYLEALSDMRNPLTIVLVVLVGNGVVCILTLLLWLISGAALAEEATGPLACDPKERRDVCEIKIQRNTAQDQVAVEKRKQELMINAEQELQRYWKEWIDGDQAKAAWWAKLWSAVSEHTTLTKR